MKISTLAVSMIVLAGSVSLQAAPTYPERFTGHKANGSLSLCSVEINNSTYDDLPVSARVLSQASNRPISLEIVTDGPRVAWKGERVSGAYTYSLVIESDYDGVPTSYTFKQKLEGNPHTIEERCNDLKLQQGMR